MLDNRAWDTIADRLVADDFYRRDHQLIFEAIAELAGRSEPSDAVTLSEWLERKGIAEQTGGLVYLAGLVRDTPSAANVRAYADAVRERSTLRRLISVGGEIASSAYDPRRPRRDRAGRRSRAARVRDRRERQQGAQRLHPLEGRARLGHRSARPAAAEQGTAAGPQHRLCPARRNDRGTAEGRPDRHRRPAVDGQDDLCHQHCRERRIRRRARRRSASSAWKCRASRSRSA